MPSTGSWGVQRVPNGRAYHQSGLTSTEYFQSENCDYLLRIIDYHACVFEEYKSCALRTARAIAYATQIDSDDREPLRQLRHDRAIFEPIFGEPVNQDYARPFAAANVVKRDPIDRRGFGGEFLA